MLTLDFLELEGKPKLQINVSETNIYYTVIL